MRQSDKEEIITSLLVSASLLHRPSDKPGDVIKRLPKEMRDKLSQLTSDDYRKMRYLGK